jgi:twitching motility protein PilI
VLVVQHREVPVGLLVDEVLGFRRFPESTFEAVPPPTLVRCEHYLAGVFRREGEAWPVFGLRRLVESPAFLAAAR